ncbi:MAG TPA: M20/M25/M40 family metallo-hydrolase [Pyrinomonadaceae bacterium]|nr:M20/M25/M40 family metallo-hydrolase [Pyrinomonadaceae bacterium]
MKYKRLIILISALVLAAATIAAQQALEPNAARLQQDISYLASDALNGRRTGTQGANDAAHYIAGEFARAGLRPISKAAASRRPSVEMARYLQAYPYVAGARLGKQNLLTAKMNDAVFNFEVGKDWMPLGISANQALEQVPVVFVKYGITASELNYNDYSDPKVTGRIAIAQSGTPDGDNPHGQFARYEDVHWKAIAARNAGAKALFVIAREKNFADDRLSVLHVENTAGDAGIPVIGISQKAAADLFTNDVPWLINLSTDISREQTPAYNVVGVLDGSDPTLKNETIIIGAHYDHLGRGGEGSLAPRSGEIHHGADDNASGTAGVIELARLFSAQRPRLKRTLVFIAFSGEEEGLLGSNYYVNHPLLPLANTVAMINMDMIGRMKDHKLVIGGVGTAKEWHDILAKDKPFDLILNEDGYGPSDHSSFYSKQVPVLFFWTGPHGDYHKPSDTFDKINYTDEARILAMVARVVRDVDSADKRLTYTTAKTDPAPRSVGFRVYLGTIPNYGDSTDGLLLDGVRDDSPAAKAGLKAGDKVVKIANRDVKNVYDYTAALGEMKAGQEYVVEIVRGGERLSLKIVPEARK